MTIVCQSWLALFLLFVPPCFAAPGLAKDKILQGQILKGSYSSDSKYLQSENLVFSPSKVANSSIRCDTGNNFDNHSVSYNYSLPFSIKEDYSSLTESDCETKCAQNCSCFGYASLHENGTGCEFWGSDISNSISDSSSGIRVLYIRGNSSSPGGGGGGKGSKWHVWLITCVGATLLVIISVVCIIRNYCMKENLTLYGQEAPRTPRREHVIEITEISNEIRNEKIDDKMSEFPLIRFEAILLATENFSEENKLGEGGFGPVFRGKLDDGQEIAVKRLARSSSQGLVEFQNEVQLIVKLQHNNLVRLFGCCIHRDEMMLVYEYLPNRSLDFFLFDSTKKGLLKWENRMNIIEGIAQGLLYLHKHSRLKVIHRDLKASNILLDLDMNPKISDFGTARIMGVDDFEDSTKRVIGTRGYMAPEYLIHGMVSPKIDVFSFGVLVLEMVSSKRNYCSYNAERDLNLIGLAWKLWNDGRALDLVDTSMHISDYVDEVGKCISVGLLCVQDDAADRPSMEDVVFMLRHESKQVPTPKRPAFFCETHSLGKEIEESLNLSCSTQMSNSIFMDAR